MGVHSGIHIYGFRKPTLELELVEGGTLLANTKYYVLGVYSFNPVIFNSVGSTPSDVYEITTTSTARSIKITQKTYREVLGFTDNGDGRTIVNCDRHCFADGDEVKFASGSYAGTYILEWVDYDNFIINTSYIDNVATECYSDTFQYNQSTPNVARYTQNGMVYYIDTNPPTNYGDNKWSRRAYATDYIENPTTITAPVSSNWGDNSNIVEINGLNTGIWSVLEGYGTPYVDVYEYVTLDEIEAEFQAAGFPYHFTYSIQGYNNSPQLTMIASMRIRDNGEIPTILDTIVNVCGEINCEDYPESLTFNYCTFNVLVSLYSMSYNFTMNDSVLKAVGGSNIISGWIYGDRNTIMSIPRSGLIGDIPDTFYDQQLDEIRDYYIIENKDYKLRGGLIQNSYCYNKYRNCTLIPFYWVLREPDGMHPDIYMIENSKIVNTNYDYHFRAYGYSYTGQYTMDFLNVDTDAPNNVKYVVNNGPGNFDFNFYRRLEFYVQGDLLMLEGVTVSIEDNAGNTYSGTTDINGYAFIDVIEQFTHIVFADGTTYAVPNDYNTYYGDFNITFTKDGYQTETLLIDNGYGNEVNNIAMVENIPPEPPPLRIKGLKIQ